MMTTTMLPPPGDPRRDLLRAAEETRSLGLCMIGLGALMGTCVLGNLSPFRATSGVYLLSKLSENTGGLHFVVRDRRQLPEVAAKLATAINNLYVIGYRAPESFLSGKWRRVKIRLENPSGARLRVATRSGYFPD